MYCTDLQNADGKLVVGCGGYPESELAMNLVAGGNLSQRVGQEVGAEMSVLQHDPASVDHRLRYRTPG